MALAPVAQACEPRDALLILDASESMTRNSGSGPPRMSVARRAVQAALDIFPDDARIALRLYGSQAGAGVRNCEDSVLVVGFAPAATNRIEITEAMSRVRARGLTPIEYALEEAAGDFPEDATRTIILVSDGRESCGGDPCAAAAKLATQGFVINTVGFQVDRVGQSQLMCIAKASGGQYFDVPVAVGLADKLREALSNCVVAGIGTRLRPS
jgi:Ca-activated chloride channel family protein